MVRFYANVRTICYRELDILIKINRLKETADKDGFVFLDCVVDLERNSDTDEHCFWLNSKKYIEFRKRPNSSCSKQVRLTEKGIQTLKDHGVFV